MEWNTLGGCFPQLVGHDLSHQRDNESLVISPRINPRSEFQPGSIGLASTLVGEVPDNWLNPSSVFAEASGMKSGGVFQSWKYLQNPFKKVRGLGEMGNSSMMMGETWQGMNVQERCLMIERTVYADAELQRVLVRIHAC